MDNTSSTPKKVQENSELKENAKVAPQNSQTLSEPPKPRNSRFRSRLRGFL